MDFEKMKLIWDSQNQEPLYAIDQAALHRLVRHKSRKFSRRTAWCRWREISLGVAFGCLMLTGAGLLASGDPGWLATRSWVNVPVSPWDVAALLAAGAIWFYYAGYMYAARRRQQRLERVFDSTLRGDIDRALSRIEFEIVSARSILWWGLLPTWFAAMLWVVVALRLKDVHAWAYAMVGAVMLGALAVAVGCHYWEIAKRFQPHRRELESLRTKLADASP